MVFLLFLRGLLLANRFLLSTEWRSKNENVSLC